MKKLLFISLVALSFASCKTEEKKEVATTFNLKEVKTAIIESNKAYGAAFANGDSSSLISKYTKDGCIMPANAPRLCSSNGIAMFYNGAKSMGIQNVVLTTDEVMGGPEVVVETGTYEILGAENVSFDKGKYLVAWKQEDGKWKMHRDMFTTDAPLPAAK